MKDIKELRKEIDAIDDEMIPLFESRMDVAKQVAEYKRAAGATVLQSGREKEVLDLAVERLKDKSYANEARDFMTAVMDLSKEVQLKTNPVEQTERERKPFLSSAKVGYQGTKGSYSNQAAEEYFGKEDDLTAYHSFEDVFRAIDSGEITYGVVPLENSSVGSVVEVYDLLGKYNCFIVGEKWIRINHCLIGVKGAKISDVKTVYSKGEALGQAHDFLAEGGFNLVSYANTALAAEMVAEKGDKSLAAVAAESAAKIYGLDVLAKGINSDRENFTRFIVISKTLSDSEADKVSVSFTLNNESGALYKVLRFFSRYGINMVKIESRPLKNNPGSYYFVVDLEGNCKSKDMIQALYYVEKSTINFKLLGEYVKSTPQEDK